MSAFRGDGPAALFRRVVELAALGLTAFAGYWLAHRLRDPQVLALLTGASLAVCAGILHLLLERQRQLRESEQHARNHLELMPEMPWVCDARGQMLSISPQYEKWSGVPTSAALAGQWQDRVHPDDRELVFGSLRRALSTGEPLDVENRSRSADGSYRWIRGRARPWRDEKGIIRRWYGTTEDIHDQQVAAYALRRVVSLVQMMGDATPNPIYARDREHRLLYANRALAVLLGRTPDQLVGQTDLFWSSNRDKAHAFEVIDRHVMATGTMVETEESFTHSDGKMQIFQSIKSPLRDPTGKIVGMFAMINDITEKREAEQREKLLMRELDHHSKKLLTVIQSVLQLTEADDIDHFRASVSGQIQALGRNHAMLAEENWEGADLQCIFDAELAADGRLGLGEVRLLGPRLRLRPQSAQCLALIVHELATNAAKYGALSVAGGDLEVDWQVGSDPDHTVVLNWRERGGPRGVRPLREGFGSRLIEASVARQLRGTVNYRWDEQGLSVTLRFAGTGQLVGEQPNPQGARPEPIKDAPKPLVELRSRARRNRRA